MSQTKIAQMTIENGTLTLPETLLPKEWTAPVWVLWEEDEPYLTLFPSMPSSDMLENTAGCEAAEVSDGTIRIPPIFIDMLADPSETITVRSEPAFVEFFGQRVWDALKGAFTNSQDVFW